MHCFLRKVFVWGIGIITLAKCILRNSVCDSVVWYLCELALIMLIRIIYNTTPRFPRGRAADAPMLFMNNFIDRLLSVLFARIIFAYNPGALLIRTHVIKLHGFTCFSTSNVQNKHYCISSEGGKRHISAGTLVVIILTPSSGRAPGA